MPDTDDIINKEIAQGDFDPVRKVRSDKRQPSYKVLGDSKIPVSRAHGKLWQSRKEQVIKAYEHSELPTAWDEALRYYRNDQISHRHNASDDPDYAGNESNATRMYRRFSLTENVVFANTSALVPTIYAKNPRLEFTAIDQQDEALVPLLERLAARIMSKKASPGINLKPKARKSVVMSALTNAAYIEVGWTFKEQSSEQALLDLGQLAKKLEKAKTPQQVEEIEGQITALEQHIDVLRPAGPWARFRRPQDVFADPDSLEDDHSDARWMMVRDWLDTSYLNARFRDKKGDTHISLFKPTHVVNAGDSGGNSAQSEIDLYTLLDNDNAAAYGYNDQFAYDRAKRTMVWWIWDHTTMRVLLYADNEWDWPIWVWDDPYNLQSFFPLKKLQFYTDPDRPMSKGEVTYYLDQQDELNTINSELKQARQWARRNLFYDKNRVSRDEVEKFIKGDEDVCVGIDVPEGMTLKDFVQSIVPPSIGQFAELFDKTPILEAIDRVSSVQPVMRGVEFKTNTTNEAINKYNSIQQTRTDEKIDAVEDFIGYIGWDIIQLALQFMETDQVAELIGDDAAKSWTNLSAVEIRRRIQLSVVGGSTQKQTSEAKKKQALDMGQVLGQFVNAAPVPVVMVMLKTFRNAFNDVIADEDWTLIIDAVSAMAQQPQGPAGEAPSSEGDAPAEQGSGDEMAQIEQMIDTLPPAMKRALGNAIAQGVPIREVLMKLDGATRNAA